MMKVRHRDDENLNYQIVNSNELKLTSEHYQVVRVLPHSRSRRDTPPADSTGSNAPASLPDPGSQQVLGTTTGATTAATGVSVTSRLATTAVPSQLPDSNSSSNANTTVVPSKETKPSSIATTESTTTVSDPFENADHIHDYHTYYNSEVYKNKDATYWQEVTDIPRHETLSTGHRVAAVIPLKFPFHFYGHTVTNVTVATGGFIYMSPFLHQWLTATQYIAPLMANFDPSLNKDSGIYYKSDDDKFTVEWKNVMLKDQNASGLFNFQAILHKDDVIHFVYKSVPVSIRNISTDEHPVKIGLSDAYYNDTYLPEYKIKRRTIYEYHKVSIKIDTITNGTVVVLKPLPTCNRLLDCNSCVKHENMKFDCKWCNTIGRCSDGLDWYRQHWDKEGCQQSNGSSVIECPPVTTTGNPTSSWSFTDTTEISQNLQKKMVDDCGLPNVTEICSPFPHLVRPITDSLYPDSEGTCNHTNETSDCSSLPPPMKSVTDLLSLVAGMKDPCQNGKCNQKNNFPVAVIVVIVFIICGLLAAIGGWVYYAYTHPTSKSGMWLMEHRPSQIKANIKFWKSSTDAGTKYKQKLPITGLDDRVQEMELFSL
ncbi:Plexin domain-containing protein 1 [Bulinus truncatus]|nr:Plexin domain-containing protein 1 [Bulinus truncatus]